MVLGCVNLSTFQMNVIIYVDDAWVCKPVNISDECDHICC